MSYKITITKTEPNPNFAEELKSYKSSRGFGYSNDTSYPVKEITTDVLTCDLTEEQFKKVKLEALKVFE